MSGGNGDIGQARIEVRAPEVIHESIDGEVIIINLATGTYYSLKGSAAEIWGLIQQPAGVHGSQLLQVFAGRTSSADELRAGMEPFLAQLREEGLVSWTEDPFVHTLAESQAQVNGDDAQPFGPPILEKFTDMQDLVLLDPVHEVAKTGWPVKPDDAAGGQAA